MALPASAAGDPVVRPGRWNKGKVPKGWVVVDTEHYHVQSEVGEEKAERLAAHLERVNACYEEFLPTRRKSEAFVLKLFATRKEFCDYGNFKPADGPLAYYSQGTKELVGYDTGVILDVRDVPAGLALAPDCKATFTAAETERLKALFEAATDACTMDTARVLSHEGWHQYFHNYTVSIVTMPSWLDEGIGDYFFTATLDEQNPDGGHGYRLGDINVLRLRTVRRAVADGTTVTFGTLLDFEQQQYYSNPGVFYAQGWSMVEFLLQHRDSKYRELIPKLIKDFKDSKNFRKSTAKVFKGFDLEALDREWLGWLLGQPLTDPLYDLAREFGGRLKVADLKGDERWLKVYKGYVDHPDFTLGPPPAGAPPPAPPPAPPKADPPPADAPAADPPGKGAPAG